MRGATIRQCAILAGGLATRLGALTDPMPKPLLPVGGRPFLAWLLRELLRFGIEDVVLLTGHRSEQIEAALPAIMAALPRPLTVAISREPEPAGTGGALHHARARLHERFLVCNGDSLFTGNLARLLAAMQADSSDVVGRMMLCHVDDASRYGSVTMDGDLVTGFAEKAFAGAGLINAGIYAFDREVLDFIDPRCSLERDVLPRLAIAGRLRATVASGYFVDIGVPADLARADTELPRRLRRPALFLDRDGVINRDCGYVGTRERFAFMPGALAGIADATDRGLHVFIATNQSGVARGFYDEAAVLALHRWISAQVLAAGGTIDDIRFCPYHPQAAVAAYRRQHDWRKPSPGMLLDIMRHWELDPARCLMVGDQASDLAAARAAGVPAVLFDQEDLGAFLANQLTGSCK